MLIIKSTAADAVRIAAEILNGGGVVAYPTETFYALGVKYDSVRGLERLFALKGRPPEKAASVILGSEEDLKYVALDPPPQARALMRLYWPGPLTLVLTAREGLPSLLTKDDTIAVRIPGESFALRMVRELGYPVTATSANPSGKEPPTDARQVREYFPEGIDMLIEGARTPGGEPSTIAALMGEGIRVIREGAVPLK